MIEMKDTRRILPDINELMEQMIWTLEEVKK